MSQQSHAAICQAGSREGDQGGIQPVMRGEDRRIIDVFIDLLLQQDVIESGAAVMECERVRFPAKQPGHQGMGIFMREEIDRVRDENPQQGRHAEAPWGDGHPDFRVQKQDLNVACGQACFD
ncbi:hypothetical protein AAC691_13615 [Nguyenibacter vanlangensis]|uniref:Uncharacterized protein n=1 Tax=Nguyenibacter vanlangensis TaxID=1216886 RepID=A0ABZ3D192_9PROT